MKANMAGKLQKKRNFSKIQILKNHPSKKLKIAEETKNFCGFFRLSIR